jgi:hypothetical protein
MSGPLLWAAIAVGPGLTVGALWVGACLWFQRNHRSNGSSR